MHSCYLLLDLQEAIEDEDETKADAVRDRMETPGYGMSYAEHQAAQLLSGDLNDAWEVLRGDRALAEHYAVRLTPKGTAI